MLRRPMPTPRILVNALSLSEGGGRSYVTNLARELGRDSRGFAFTLLGLDGAFDGIDTGSLPVETIRLPSSPRALRVPSRVLFEQLLLPLRARRFDLLQGRRACKQSAGSDLPEGVATSGVIGPPSPACLS